MRKKIFNCKVITPLFCFGADGNIPELRPTELKGLMRYVYRITQQEVSSVKLFMAESKRFGSTEIPSPLRLQMIPGTLKMQKQSLTLHKDGNMKQSIKIGSTFDIILRFRNNGNNAETDMEWYKNMIKLSFYLSGMGKRTRRARGCVRIDEEEKTIHETKKDILHLLNEIAEQGIYERNGDCIVPTKQSNTKRPVIEKISFGELGNRTLDDFLRRVDMVGHETKATNGKPMKDATLPTGSVQLASSIIVSVAKTIEGYLPIYTFVKAVYDEQILDDKLAERLAFQQKIESVGTAK